MKIFVKVKTGAKKDEISKISETEYMVCVKDIPEKGKANMKVIELVSKHLNISKNLVRIKIGKTSHNKILEVDYDK